MHFSKLSVVRFAEKNKNIDLPDIEGDVVVWGTVVVVWPRIKNRFSSSIIM